MSSPIKLVILDRDGTINYERGNYIKNAHEWEPLPGAIDAIARLSHAGFHVVVATNQDGLGLEIFDVSALNAVHTKMHKLLSNVGGRIDAVFYCPHTVEEACSCRKPQTGLFAMIGERYSIPLDGVPFVSGRVSDLVGTIKLKCEQHLVFTGKSEGLDHLSADSSVGLKRHIDLAAAAEFLIKREELIFS